MLHLTKNLINLTWDYFYPARPEQILDGSRMFRPFLNYQKNWFQFTHPGEVLNPEMDSWHYLQKFVMPLILKHASSYHLNGITKLQLSSPTVPIFKEFQNQFFHQSKGFSAVPVTGEIRPQEYFEMIKSKCFPCVQKLRDFDEIFCGNEPDFWHEAIGHIAPLCSLEIQDLYLEVAKKLLASKSKREFHKRLAIAWTFLEYGFIKENEELKMFGAAITGSHLANIRYLHKLINVEKAMEQNILDSRFFDEKSPIAKTLDGKFRFFYFDF